MEHKKLMFGAEMLEKVDNQFNLLEVIANSAMPFGEVFTATNVLNAVSSVLAKKLGLKQDNDVAQNATFILTKVIVLETAQNVFNIGSGVKNFNMDSFTLAKVVKMVERIEKKVDLILDTPLQLAIETLKSTLNIMEAGDNPEALKYLEQMNMYAMKAFEYTKKGNGKKEFKNAVFAKQLLAFGKIMTFSYEKERNHFLPFHILPSSKKELIAKELENIANDIIAQAKNIQPKILNRLLPGGTKKDKGEIQNLVDSILRITYPYISEGKGWTSMLQKVLDKGNHIKLIIDPTLLPDGEEDATEVCLGRKQELKQTELLMVKMWKNDSLVFVASDKVMQECRCDFLAEVLFDTMDKIVLTGYGNTGGRIEDKLGQYRLHSNIEGSVVYKQENDTGGRDIYLYKTSTAWYVHHTIGREDGYLINRKKTPMLPTTGWAYNSGQAWVQDTNITSSAGPAPPCGNITITAIGEAAKRWPSCLGTFQATDQWSSGLNVFMNKRTGWYLLVPRGSTTWCVRSSPDNAGAELQSGGVSHCPAGAGAAWNQRFEKRRWQYKTGSGFVEGNIRVVCTAHKNFTIVDGRQSSMVDNLQCKEIFGRKKQSF